MSDYDDNDDWSKPDNVIAPPARSEGSGTPAVREKKNGESLIDKTVRTFDSITSNKLVNSIISAKNDIARVKNEIAVMKSQGHERRENIKASYMTKKSTLDGINNNIESIFEEMKRFDVNTMNEIQAKLYENMLKSTMQLRAASLQILQDIFN